MEQQSWSNASIPPEDDEVIASLRLDAKIHQEPWELDKMLPQTMPELVLLSPQGTQIRRSTMKGPAPDKATAEH